MPLKKPSHKLLRSLCAEVHPDDGADPRVVFREDGSRGKVNHKARRLCGQVAETLDGVLADDPGDDVLRALGVVAVEPAPDASRLLVTVGARLPAEPIDPALLLDRLERASGRLRSEVAAAITRKRAPILVFRVAVPTGPA